MLYCSRCHGWDWPQLNMEDKLCQLRAFLALTLTMGMIKKPAIEDYWSQTNWSINTPVFSSVMSLKRFQLLLRFFHIRDNSTCLPRGDPNYDPLFRIFELIVQLNDTFMNYYTPARDVAVDDRLAVDVDWLQRQALFCAIYAKQTSSSVGSEVMGGCGIWDTLSNSMVTGM